MVTTYLALALAGVKYPLSVWPSVNFYVWMMMIVALATKVITFPSPQGAFAMGALATTFTYALAASFQFDQLNNYFSIAPRLPMPHDLLVEWLVPERTTTGFIFGGGEVNPVGARSRLTLYRWGVTNFSLLFGVIGGLLALWRYKSNHRRIAGS